MIISINGRIARLAGVSLFLLMTVGLAENYWRPELKEIAKDLMRKFKLVSEGETSFTLFQLDRQLTPRVEGGVLDVQLIETAVLPLDVTSMRITSSINFPLGAGSMTSVGGRLILMDRLGSLYVADKNAVSHLEVPHLPNDLESFIQHSRNSDLNMDTFRSHSIAFSSRDQKLYASYEKYVNPANNRFEISSIPFDVSSGKATGPWQLVYKSDAFTSLSYGLAGGGKILASGERLFFAVGDYGFYAPKDQPDSHAAQDPKSSFGKIYEIHKNGEVEMLSLGHRNTQGLVFSNDGQLINLEQGPQGGDELNIIERGKNYGWPIDTFGTDYGKYTWKYQEENHQRKLQWPLYSFVPSVATSSIIQVNEFHKRWNGDFLLGSLKAQTLFRLKIHENRVMLIEPIWIGHRIRELVELPGRIVLLTDDGLLMTVTVDQNALKRDGRGVDSVASKVLTKCMACHHMGLTNPSHLAPTLSELDARPIASDTYGKYSEALRHAGGTWSRDRLRAFLLNPASVMPGTAMPKPELTEEELKDVLDGLIASK